MHSVSQVDSTEQVILGRAVHPGVSDINGEYFFDNNVQESSDLGRDMDMAKRLWNRSTAFIENF